MSILDKLEALERAATPGPWRIQWAAQPEDLSDPQAVGIEGPEHFGFGGNDMNDIVGIDGEYGVSTYDNAEFIVAVRNALPAMLAVLRAAERSADWPSKQDCDYSVIQRELESAVHALRALDGAGGAK